MKNINAIAALYWVAATYDGVLGAVFIVIPGRIFEWTNVTPPNHFGYVQFPGALLCVFALMFTAVARDAVQNRNLIVYGTLLKISFCGVALSYWVTQDVPNLWKPFVVMDLAFIVFFVLSYIELGKREATLG